MHEYRQLGTVHFGANHLAEEPYDAKYHIPTENSNHYLVQSISINGQDTNQNKGHQLMIFNQFDAFKDIAETDDLNKSSSFMTFFKI